MHAVKCHILCCFLFLILCVSNTHGTTLSIEHTTFRFNRKTNIHHYSQPRVTYGNTTTSARELVYDKNTKILLFSGNVIIRLPRVVLTADTATFNQQTGRNTLEQATMYDSQNGVYVEADRIEQVSEEEYIIHKGSMTRCKQNARAWELRGHRIVYQVDNYAYSISTSLHFYGLPIFYTPYFSFPTKQSRSTGFLMPVLTSVNSSDESKNYGNRLQVPYFIALDRDHDVTITGDLIQNRGLGFGVDYRYAFTKDMSGQFTTWFIKEIFHNRDLDYEELGSLDRNDNSIDLNPFRYKYAFNHRQNIFLNGQFFFNQYENGDNEINKEYFDTEVDLDTHFSRTISLIFPWSTGSLSLSHVTEDDFIYESTYDNSNDAETHLNKHPTVSVSQRFSRIADTPVSVSLSGTGTQYAREIGWNGQLRQGSMTVSAPFYIDFLNIWPSVTRTWSTVDATYTAASGSSSQDPFSYDWQIDKGSLELNFEIYRLFYNDDTIATRKLSIKPRAIYSEVQDVDQSEDDTTSFISTVYSRKTLTYKLETRYLVKDLDKNTTRTFLSLDLTQIYNLQMEDEDATWYSQASYLETDPGEPRLPLRISLTLSPSSLFSTSLFYRWDHNKSRVVETGITLSTGTTDGDRFALSYTDNETRYREPDNTNHPAASVYSISHTLRIDDRWTFYLSGAWDQSRADLDSRYEDSSSTDLLDRQLTDLTASLQFNHGCYRFSVAYQEEIEDELVNNVTTEYLEKKLVLTLQFSILPTTAGGSKVQTTGAQYQESFLLPR